MNKSKVAVVASVVTGKILSIAGWIGAILFALVGTIGLAGVDEGDSVIAVFIICLILVGISILMILKGIQIKGRIKRFKQYVSLISSQQMTSLDNIAVNVNKPVDFVKTDIQKMISMSFFANASIDANNEIIIGGKSKSTLASAQTQTATQAEMVTYTCNGCDSQGTKPKGSSASCEYCGNAV
jgi:hypothetical protein